MMMGDDGLLIYLVRHAESTANVAKILPDDQNAPPYLTERGTEQAKRLSSFLHSLPIDAVFSSPMGRAVETARIIGQKLNLQVKVDYRLREMGLGKLAGKNYMQLREEDPNWYDEMFLTHSKYGLEKFADVMERMVSFIQETSSSGHRRVVAVSHLEPIRSVVASGMKDDGRHIREVRLENSSVTIASYGQSGIRLKCINWVPIDEYSE